MENLLFLGVPILKHIRVLYFFGYKTEIFYFQNNSKNLDPPYKMDLDLLRLFQKGKTHIIAKFHWTDLAICNHSGDGKHPTYSQINTVVNCSGGLRLP